MPSLFNATASASGACTGAGPTGVTSTVEGPPLELIETSALLWPKVAVSKEFRHPKIPYVNVYAIYTEAILIRNKIGVQIGRLYAVYIAYVHNYLNRINMYLWPTLVVIRALY